MTPLSLGLLPTLGSSCQSGWRISACKEVEVNDIWQRRKYCMSRQMFKYVDNEIILQLQLCAQSQWVLNRTPDTLTYSFNSRGLTKVLHYLKEHSFVI